MSPKGLCVDGFVPGAVVELGDGRTLKRWSSLVWALVAHAWITSTGRGVASRLREVSSHMLQQNLGYLVRPCLTKTKGRAEDVAQ